MCQPPTCTHQHEGSTGIGHGSATSPPSVRTSGGRRRSLCCTAPRQTRGLHHGQGRHRSRRRRCCGTSACWADGMAGDREASAPACPRCYTSPPPLPRVMSSHEHACHILPVLSYRRDLGTEPTSGRAEVIVEERVPATESDSAQSYGGHDARGTASVTAPLCPPAKRAALLSSASP